ncbi:unnamed protein product [Ixodes hexagonus]
MSESSNAAQSPTVTGPETAAPPETQVIQEHDTSVKRIEVMTKNCGKLTVHVQGDMDNLEKKAVFLTVHDIGNNRRTSSEKEPKEPRERTSRSDNMTARVQLVVMDDRRSAPADFNFPTIQMIGEDLISVVDHLKINLVVGFGEGAGANILVRFALAHSSRVLGLILMHLVSTGVGMMEYFKDKIMNWKLQNVGMNPSAEQYLVLHKFGAQLEMVDNKERLISDYTEKLKKRINPRNLKRYVESYMNRKDISGLIETNLK